MTRRRAITLVEVVAAAALLAVTVGALVPLLRDARGVGDPDDTAVVLFDLSRAVDVVVGGLEAPGIEQLAQSPRQLDWPGDPFRGEIKLRARIIRDDARVWAWVTFEHDGLAVARWVDLPGAQP